jgi:hypothetical protein
MDVQQAINLQLFRKSEEVEIGFAFPIRTAFINQEAGVSGLSGEMKDK